MTDEEYVMLARGGDRAAQEALLKKYQPMVSKISARFFLFGGEPEDLEQEGLVGLYNAIGGFSPCGAKFSTYAYKCIRNSVLDAVKKSVGAKNSALNNFVPIVEIGEEAFEYTPEDEIIRRENRREFLQKISKNLSSLEFKIIVMYLDGIGIAEIAEVLGKPVKSVSNAINRAKSKLEVLYSVPVKAE